ncbi:hypothetical protein COT75_00695 [Candidatus Beckwithbacteria bacterium CG10_big_fil_rev_8_21_14_0_10_34_10]|uniref:Uncharacterized protein n=1 Tax=Candidatus Beckwithbacteria bacterium CG10_big_fil_rev_8_21_14_0_10_34_10 TaxID=1974495 RepID=A0A2H0WAK4_9BACT|nr:MAG: hypothetical protein COT75_00695 [Candidatus Beckwithbacteria bacterium CG10_big_fil_rev_8_21_14_0_10_34_10]
MSDEQMNNQLTKIGGLQHEKKYEDELFNTALLIDIFTQVTQIKGKDVTPLNANEILPEIRRQNQREYDFQKEIYDQIVELN